MKKILILNIKKYWKWEVISLAIFLFYFILILLVTKLSPNDTEAEKKRELLTVSFMFITIIEFVDIIHYVKRIIFIPLRNNKYGIYYMQGLKRKDIIAGNIGVIYMWILLKYAIALILTSSLSFFSPEVNLINKITNIINSLFVVTFWASLLIALSLYFSDKNTDWLFNIFFGTLFVIMWIMILSACLTSGIGTHDLETNKFAKIIGSIPFFGLSSPIWIIYEKWYSLINIPISIAGTGLLFFIIHKINSKITY